MSQIPSGFAGLIRAGTIPEEERVLAALTHLSGLAGYVIPFGGAIVPIVIWVVKSDSPVVSSIAKQALILNVFVFVFSMALFLLSLTVILIPLTVVAGILLALAALILPVVGALKAYDGDYFRYPLIGLAPL